MEMGQGGWWFDFANCLILLHSIQYLVTGQCWAGMLSIWGIYLVSLVHERSWEYLFLLITIFSWILISIVNINKIDLLWLVLDWPLSAELILKYTNYSKI